MQVLEIKVLDGADQMLLLKKDSTINCHLRSYQAKLLEEECTLKNLWLSRNEGYSR